MNAEYIIIQAGGKGTRLQNLTKNKPKAIVPVNNLPIIFHIFKKYPDKKFIIIGDYKFDILQKYLQTFANAQYLLVHTKEQGNNAGIREALSYIPDKVPFMLIWSDLILSETFDVSNAEKGCHIGISENFSCSWSFENGKMEKVTSKEHGVAGCFTFEQKELLKDIPVSGSFAKWLSESGIVLEEFSMQGSMETGSIDAIRSIDSGENRCRPYNHMEFTKDKVIKTGLTKEGKDLINRELLWYKAVSDYGFDEIPKIYSYEPLTMEKIDGENIFKAKLDDEQKKETIDRLIDSLQRLHGYEKAEKDIFGLQEDYFNKTIKRIQGIRDVIPFTNEKYITINGKKCRNVFFFQDELQAKVKELLYDAEFGPIHGDCTLTNTMIDRTGKIYFIDARGYFGKRAIFGDVYYDWAKLYYSINGKFDQFNIKNFNLEISANSVELEIAASGWEHLTEYFLNRIDHCDISKIKLIHAIVWLSLASHAWEDYDSLCAAFYHGTLLLEECL